MAFDVQSYLLGLKAGKGGGGSSIIVPKSITENGTYNASEDNANGYNPIVVNVSGGGSMGLTKYPLMNELTLEITEEYVPDPEGNFYYAYGEGEVELDLFPTIPENISQKHCVVYIDIDGKEYKSVEPQSYFEEEATPDWTDPITGNREINYVLEFHLDDGHQFDDRYTNYESKKIDVYINCDEEGGVLYFYYDGDHSLTNGASSITVKLFYIYDRIDYRFLGDSIPLQDTSREATIIQIQGDDPIHTIESLIRPGIYEASLDSLVRLPDGANTNPTDYNDLGYGVYLCSYVVNGNDEFLYTGAMPPQYLSYYPLSGENPSVIVGNPYLVNEDYDQLDFPIAIHIEYDINTKLWHATLYTTEELTLDYIWLTRNYHFFSNYEINNPMVMLVDKSNGESQGMRLTDALNYIVHHSSEIIQNGLEFEPWWMTFVF